MAPKKDFSDPRVISVLARYKKDLQSVKAVKSELERTLGWETTLQTVWRHLKSFEKEQEAMIRAKGEYPVIDWSLSWNDIDVDDHYGEEAIDVAIADDDSYISSSTPPKLLRENRSSTKRYVGECCRLRSPQPVYCTSLRHSSAPSQIHRMRSKRLTMSSLVIREKDNPQFVRVYRQTAATNDTVYYRCSTCDTIKRKLKASRISMQGADNGNERGTEFCSAEKNFRWRATVKTIHGRVVGNPYPQHHPDCHPISADQQKALETYRSIKAKLKDGRTSSSSATLMRHRIDQNGRSGYDDEADDMCFPFWRRVNIPYYDVTGNTHSGISHMPVASSTIRARASKEVIYTYTLSPKIRFVVSLPEERALEVEAGNDSSIFMGIPNNQLNGGIEQGPFPRARIRAVDGRIVGNAYPTHHPDCRPMSARIFKAREIDTGCRYRIKQGLISPRQAWDLGHQIAESKSLNDHTEEGIPFPQWDRVKRKYYKLSKGIKTRVDAVEEVLLDEERADLSCEKDLRNHNDEQRHIIVVENETTTSITPTCDTKSADVTDSLGESISHDIEQQESEVTDGSISLGQIDDELEDEESPELERIEMEHEESPTFNEEDRREEFDQEQVLEHAPEVESEAPDSRKQEQHSQCSCRQIYEANLELHEDIVRCLSEMKAMREEMRQTLMEMRCIRYGRGETKSLPMRFFP
uniref:Clr5 domain-containing protein n=1 Tax=Ascaris lumbricoides TaxID=6252 RepID=A0A9J2Q3A4_ASCLU